MPDRRKTVEVIMPDGQPVLLPENPAELTEAERSFIARMQLQKPGGPAPALVHGRNVMPSPSQLGQFLARPAPAILGGLAGGALGSLGGPLAPVTVPLGVGAGGLAGEFAAQATGFAGAKPDPLSLVLSSLVPPGASTGAGVGRVLGRFGLRGTAARELNVLGAEEAATGIAKLRSPVEVGKLFASARQSGAQIPLNNFFSTLDEISREIAQTSPSAQQAVGPVIGRIRGFADDILSRAKALGKEAAKEAFEQQGKTAGEAFRIGKEIEKKARVVDPTKLQSELEAFADLTRSIRRTGGQGGRHADRAIGALLSDLDDSALAAARNPALQGARELLEARKGFLRNQTINEMQEIIENAFQVRRGLGDARQFNPNQAMRNFEKNPFFKKAFLPEEQEAIFSLLKKINRIPVLPPPTGVEHGAGALLMRAGPAVLGGGTAAFGGASPLESVAMGGAVAGGMMGLRIARDLSIALQFRQGRQLLGQLLAGTDGAITPQIAQMLGAFAAVKGAELRESR